MIVVVVVDGWRIDTDVVINVRTVAADAVVVGRRVMGSEMMMRRAYGLGAAGV